MKPEVRPSKSVPAPARRRERSPADRKLAAINLAAVVVPPIGLAIAIAMLWGTAFDWLYLYLFAGMVVVTAFGVTVGYHRLCTHKSFDTPAVVRYLFAVAGSMAVQGPVIRWCGEHLPHDVQPRRIQLASVPRIEVKLLRLAAKISPN